MIELIKIAENANIKNQFEFSKMLKVQDNGVGIELKENWGIGLKIMQYRASSINATLFIESSPNNGTIVRCIF